MKIIWNGHSNLYQKHKMTIQSNPLQVYLRVRIQRWKLQILISDNWIFWENAIGLYLYTPSFFIPYDLETRKNKVSNLVVLEIGFWSLLFGNIESQNRRGFQSSFLMKWSGVVNSDMWSLRPYKDCSKLLRDNWEIALQSELVELARMWWKHPISHWLVTKGE